MTYKDSSKSCDYEQIAMSGWRMYVRTDFPKSEITRVAHSDISRDGLRSDFEHVWSSAASNVYKCTMLFNGIAHSVYLKQYFYRSWDDPIKHLFRPCRAKRDFQASVMLRANGFNAPVAIAMGTRRTPILGMKQFLITGEIKDAEPIHFKAENLSAKSTVKNLSYKRTLLNTFGKTVGRMHKLGICHGDMRLCNVLAKNVDGTWELFFLDNERTRKYHKLPSRLQLKNLVQVNIVEQGITRTDRLRFLRAYMTEFCVKNKKKLIEQVTRGTEKRIGRKLFY